MTREEIINEYRECGKELEILRSTRNGDVQKNGIYRISEDCLQEFEYLTQRLKELDDALRSKEED